MKKIKKNYKTKSYQCKHRYKYWWIICVYMLVPISLILFFDKVFTPLLQGYMAGAQIGEAIILNSTYAMNNVIYPFIESLMIIIGTIASYSILKFFQKKLLKSKIYFWEVKNFLKFFEIVTVLLAVVIAVYSKINSFDYSQYGYSTEIIKEVINQEERIAYIPLEEIPSIHSIGIVTRKGNLLYNMLLHMSQFMFHLSDNLEVIIAIASTVIIPLKNYSEKIETVKCGNAH